MKKNHLGHFDSQPSLSFLKGKLLFLWLYQHYPIWCPILQKSHEIHQFIYIYICDIPIIFPFYIPMIPQKTSMFFGWNPHGNSDFLPPWRRPDLVRVLSTGVTGCCISSRVCRSASDNACVTEAAMRPDFAHGWSLNVQTWEVLRIKNGDQTQQKWRNHGNMVIKHRKDMVI